MYFAVTTREGYEARPFNTRKDAIHWLIESLNGDYSDVYWIENNILCCNGTKRVDFSLAVYDDLPSLIASVAYYDDPRDALNSISDMLSEYNLVNGGSEE